MKRLFLGIPVGYHEFFEETTGIIRDLFAEAHVGWVEEKNYHLTLYFLGNISESRINDICLEMRKVASMHSSFSLCFSNSGCFVKKGVPGAIWIGINKSSRLNSLKSSVDQGLIKLFPIKAEPDYHPHLTIGRVKKAGNLRISEIRDDFPVLKYVMPVNSFNLYESILKPQGPEYLILENFKLNP